MPMGQAHRTLTRLVQGADDDVIVEVPVVEDVARLVSELAQCGIDAFPAAPPATINVREVREKSGLSQEQFALSYGLDVATVRNWEQGRTSPDLAARNYLMMISADPAGMRHWRLESARKFLNTHAA
jgi:DNA-binding transcriptional regulator YiaG